MGCRIKPRPLLSFFFFCAIYIKLFAQNKCLKEDYFAEPNTTKPLLFVIQTHRMVWRSKKWGWGWFPSNPDCTIMQTISDIPTLQTMQFGTFSHFRHYSLAVLVKADVRVALWVAVAHRFPLAGHRSSSCSDTSTHTHKKILIRWHISKITKHSGFASWDPGSLRQNHGSKQPLTSALWVFCVVL